MIVVKDVLNYSFQNTVRPRGQSCSLRKRLLISGYRDQFSRDRAVLAGHRTRVAAEDDEFFYVTTGRFVIGATDGDAGLAGSKSAPETLTTACQAAS